MAGLVLTWGTWNRAGAQERYVADPGLEAGMAAPASDLKVTAAGAKLPRRLSDRLGDWVSVKDFGAVGDGIADDTAAIQAAIDASGRGPGALGARCYLPSGTYRVTAPILLPDRRLHVFGDGGASLIVGDVADYLLKRVSARAVEGPLIVEKLAIENRNLDATRAGCVKWHGFVVGVLRDLRLVGVNGVDASENTFTSTIENCSIRRARKPTVGTSIGVMVVGHANILHSDIVGFDEGVRASGTGLNMNGCRIEVNGVGLHLGLTRTGKRLQLARSAITALSLEANDVAIWIEAMSSTLLSGITFQGSTNAPSGQSQVGLRVGAVNGSVLSAISSFGSFSSAAIALLGPISQTALSGIQASNRPEWRAWDLRTNLGEISCDGCNLRPGGRAAETALPRYTPSLQTGGISQLDLLQGTVVARNLRGKALRVPAHADHLDVQFQPAWKSGQASVSELRVLRGGGSLATGTYHYAASIVTEVGESAAVGSWEAVTMTGDAVELRFPGIDRPRTGWRRRVYRGSAAGQFDGYFDLPIGSSQPFVDSGAPYDGLKGPVSAGQELPGGPEQDENYAVFAAPSWDTSWWISKKSTTGFTVGFSKPPPTEGTLDWFLVR